jgi:hypothetical protein
MHSAAECRIGVRGRQCAALPARAAARSAEAFAGVVPMRRTRRVGSVSMGKPIGLRTGLADHRLPTRHRTPLSKNESPSLDFLVCKAGLLCIADSKWCARVFAGYCLPDGGFMHRIGRRCIVLVCRRAHYALKQGGLSFMVCSQQSASGHRPRGNDAHLP